MDGSGSETALSSFLEHHGVKGMKWGVRKDAGHEGEGAKTSKIASLDKKFDKNASSSKLTLELYNKAADAYNSKDIERINNKPQYKGQNFLRDSPLRQKYYKEHQQAFIDQLQKAADAKGTNASGTKKYHIFDGGDGSWDITSGDVKHADDGSFKVQVVCDASGMITGIKPAPSSVAQSAISAEDFLAHHGVMGMKWGRRKGGDAEPEHPASPDHVVAEHLRNQAKTSGVKSLDNADLRKLNERLQLEATHEKLVDEGPSKFKKGHDMIKDVLKGAKTLNDIYTTVNTGAKNVNQIRKLTEE